MIIMTLHIANNYYKLFPVSIEIKSKLQGKIFGSDTFKIAETLKILRPKKSHLIPGRLTCFL